MVFIFILSGQKRAYVTTDQRTGKERRILAAQPIVSAPTNSWEDTTALFCYKDENIVW
jgi:hypothetical protein